MTGKLVTVFGGSGFIGRNLVRHLATEGWRVRVAVRDTQMATFLKPAGDLGQIALMPVSIGDAKSVARAVAGADAVVNLVGILYERGKRTFKAVHVDGAATVAKAAAEAGVPKLIHMSALGADGASPSKYARSKAEGEAAVRAAFPNATIFRPCVVFGPDDGFFNLFGRLAQLSPVLPFFTNIVPHAAGGGGSKFQPVFVGDVVECMVQVLSSDSHAGKTYELGGPRIYDMREILNIVNRETMRKRWVMGLPYFVARFLAFFLEVLHAIPLFFAGVGLWSYQLVPRPFITPDQVKLLKLGNVLKGGAPGLEAFGIAPTTVEVVVPTYLKRFRPVQQNKRRLNLAPRNGH